MSKRYYVVVAIAVFCLGVTVSRKANAQVWSSCSQYATYSSGQYNVYTDEWGASSGQCLYVYSATHWTSTSNFSGNGIKAYPDTEFGLNNVALSSLSSVPTSFNVTVPGNASYDVAYDLWSANSVDEVMIWEEWNNSGPLSNGYGCSGYPSTACPIATNVNIGGSTYNVFQGNNGHNVISFMRTSQRGSGSEDVLSFMKWAANNGKLVSQTFSTADFGIEISSTSGSQNFTLNSYSSSVVTGGGGGGGLSGTHTLRPQNASGSCLDVNNWGGAGTAMQIWACGGGTNQSYYFVNQGSSIYELQPTYNSGLCLDVSGNKSSNGTTVDVWTCNGQNNQKWNAISDGGSIYELAPQNATGSRLDVYGAGTGNGTKVDIWSANGGSNQKWAVN
jgi:hypothetical protein